MERRKFLGQLSTLFAATMLARGTGVGALLRLVREADERDVAIAERIFIAAARRGLGSASFADILAFVGRQFIGTPYRAHSLELPGSEHLTVNLREFDCTTFVESVLALGRCIRRGTTTPDAFAHELQTIRYRNGAIDGYQSRLHYFTEWIADNEKKSIVRDMTAALGGAHAAKTINFMSAHRNLYRQLADASAFDAIARTEKTLSASGFAVIARSRVAAIQNRLLDGDIIGIATSITGLDVSHVGFAVHAGSAVKFLHAPLSGGTVQISERALPEYVAASKNAAGIIVARPVDA